MEFTEWAQENFWNSILKRFINLCMTDCINFCVDNTVPHQSSEVLPQ